MTDLEIETEEEIIQKHFPFFVRSPSLQFDKDKDKQYVSLESLIERLIEWVEYYDTTFLTTDKPILKVLLKELEQARLDKG